MKLRNLLPLLVVTVLVGCKAPAPKMTDDTLVTSQVNGITLTQRYIVAAPKECTPLMPATARCMPVQSSIRQ